MMIRGAIEVAQKSRVAGWMHSDTEAMRGKTVLAFVGGRCVGAGQVDCFRQDLLDAQLGDGFCGFDFPVRLTDAEPVGALIVRLQFSDAALLQQSSEVVGPAGAGSESGPDFGAIAPHRVAWMLAHGMLEQTEHDFLRAIHTAGVYERSLRMARRGNAELAGQRHDPEATAQGLIGLMLLSDVTVTRQAMPAWDDIARPMAQAAPVMALWSQAPGRISLEQGSHLPGAAAAIGPTDYIYGPDRLLLIHRACRFAASGPVPASGLVLFTALPAEAVESGRTIRSARAA